MDNSGDIQTRLEETAGKTGQYITLSHRWSEETEKSKTTAENYTARLAGSQIYLSKLFKDTVSRISTGGALRLD